MYELYMACPRTVIHTHVYYYKMVAYADKRVCTKSIVWVQKLQIFSYSVFSIIT